jgi:hypothetical protein
MAAKPILRRQKGGSKPLRRAPTCALEIAMSYLARRLFIAAMFVAFFGWLLASRAFAEDFRISTEIFVGDKKKNEESVSKTTTLFHSGVVYDFLDKPEQTAVFRKPGGGKTGRFILLDKERRVRTELSTDQLAGAMNKITNWAARERDPFLKFAANPQFEETFDRSTGQLLLASHEMSYTIKTEPADAPEALSEYREFLDWYARLNALLHAGPPPGPRLRVNAALANYRVVPVSVELARAGEKEKLRAEHEFTWLISKQDMARIDDACAALAAYRSVTNEEYLQGMRTLNNATGVDAADNADAGDESDDEVLTDDE